MTREAYKYTKQYGSHSAEQFRTFAVGKGLINAGAAIVAFIVETAILAKNAASKNRE